MTPWICCRGQGILLHVLAFNLNSMKSLLTMSSAARKARRKPGQDAEKFKVDDESGKMLIESDSDDSDDQAEEDVEGTAYKEALTSADGFTRGRNGVVKFNKDTKKRRRENAEMDDGDVEMADATATLDRKQKRKKSVVRVGQEFKAKVCCSQGSCGCISLIYLLRSAPVVM